MTFWNDPRPRPRPAARRRRSRARRLRWLAVSVAAIGAAGLVVSLATSGDGTAAPVRDPNRGPAEHRGRRDARSRVVPKAWGYTALDEPQDVLVDGATAVLLGSRSLSALDARTGDEQWRVPLEAPNPWWAIGRDMVLVSTETAFVALERESGTTRWQASAGEAAGPVALVDAPEGDPVAVVATQSGGLAGLDATTGATRWSRRLPGAPRGLLAGDDASGSVAFVTLGDEARLHLLDAGTGAVRWEQRVPGRTGAPVFAGDVVVLGVAEAELAGEVRAYALADGALRWSAPTLGAFQPGLVPVLAGDRLYVVDELGEVVSLDPATGARQWRRDLGQAVLVARPAVAGDVVVVADYAREVASIDRRTGKIRARPVSGGMPVGVAAAGDLVLVAQRLVTDDQLSAFRVAELARA